MSSGDNAKSLYGEPQDRSRAMSVYFVLSLLVVLATTVFLNIYVYSPTWNRGTAVVKTVAQRNVVDLLKSTGTYFGATIDWGNKDLPMGFSKRIAREPVVYHLFIDVRDNIAGINELKHTAEAVAATPNSWFSLTVMPSGGLDMINSGTLDQIAKTMAAINALGVPVLVRFGHEMNGNWYSWGQQPTLYRKVYIDLVKRVRERTKHTYFVWGPNIGANYPWGRTAKYSAKPTNAADWKLLDTNRDNQLTDKDDPYTPYYPGDEWVDFIGVSLFYFGNPAQTSNDVPKDDYFESYLTGESGLSPFNLYEFCENVNKPLIIAESAAAYYPKAPDSTIDREITVKSAWLKQIGGVIKSGKFPLLRLFLWFDVLKDEPASSGQRNPVDFTLSTKTKILEAAQSELLNFLEYGKSKKAVLLV